jgi:hypothetical protein
MRKASLLFNIVAAAFVCLVLSAPAHAQATRTWVSGVGDDANPCSRTAPCKTFAGAISKTAMFGEINCLDPGGYGTVTITKSITIDCHYTLGSLLNAGVNGVTINYDSFQAADTRKTVRLHGLAFNGANTGVIGVRIIGGANSAGSAVFIEDCVIDGNFGGTARGISDERSGGGELYVTNTTVRNNGATGIAVSPASGSTAISVSISNVRVQNSFFGMAIGSGVTATINESVFSGNTSGGVEADGGATMVIDRSVISGNGTGISASGTIRISNSDISFNTAGMSGTVQSFSNNRFTNNGAGGVISPIGSTSNPTGQQ